MIERFWNDGGLSGAYLAGIATQYSLQKWFYETTRYVFSVEGKVTAGYARIPISTTKSEYADIPHIAMHLSFGLGSKPMPKENKTLKDYAHFYVSPLLHHLTIYAL